MLGSNPSAERVTEAWGPYPMCGPDLHPGSHALVLNAINPGGLGAGPH